MYEGLLAFDGFRADDVVVGLIGKEGEEEEVRLADLEALAARHSDVEGLAKAVSDTYKKSGIGSPRAVAKRLAPLSGEDKEEARKKLLAVTEGDYPLTERLLPFYGILRTDLRGLPMVVLPGELYVTESPLRQNTGTHYTPRSLAEQIVEGALEPWCTSRDRCRPRTVTSGSSSRAQDLGVEGRGHCHGVGSVPRGSSPVSG